MPAPFLDTYDSSAIDSFDLEDGVSKVPSFFPLEKILELSATEYGMSVSDGLSMPLNHYTFVGVHAIGALDDTFGHDDPRHYLNQFQSNVPANAEVVVGFRVVPLPLGKLLRGAPADYDRVMLRVHAYGTALVPKPQKR